MTVLAIDPGPEESAWVIYEPKGRRAVAHGKDKNAEVMGLLSDGHRFHGVYANSTTLLIEQVACMGMAVGAEVFETVFWSGRFAQAWSGPWSRVKRHEVKMHLCGNMRAKDPNIRQALIDRWGGKERAIGNKKNPGPLHGIAGDCWSALAIAVTWAETRAGPALAARATQKLSSPTLYPCP